MRYFRYREDSLACIVITPSPRRFSTRFRETRPFIFFIKKKNVVQGGRRRVDVTPDAMIPSDGQIGRRQCDTY